MIRHLLPLAALLFLAVNLASPVGAHRSPCEDAYNLTGPLAGKSPAEGCENPSDPVGLGSSVLGLDFYFE